MNCLLIGLIKNHKMIKNEMLLLFIVFIAGCGPEAPEIDRRYQILNLSNTIIKIKFYDSFSYSLLLAETQLKTGDLFEGDFLVRKAGNPQLSYPDSNYPSRAFRGSDSLVIIFNDQAYHTQRFYATAPTSSSYSQPIDRNIFRHGNYTEVEKEKFQFEISQKDYENAEDCNGSCE